MTRERTLKVLEMFLDKQCSIERTLNHMDTTDVEIWDAVYTATKALSVESCEDTISFPKGTLKKRGKGYVVYDVEWFRKNWQTELKVMGIECEDAISRADTIEWLKKVTVTDGITFKTGFKQILTDIQNMPPVTPKQNYDLDKITAEINKLPSYVAKFNGGEFAIHIDKERVLEIIDKYISGKEVKCK